MRVLRKPPYAKASEHGGQLRADPVWIPSGVIVQSGGANRGERLQAGRAPVPHVVGAA